MLNFTIARLNLIEMGTYDEMYLRPYQTMTTPENMALLNESTKGGARINTASVADSAWSILAPSAVAAYEAPIANGWRTCRFAFMLEVIHPTVMGGARHQYLTGYTDHSDVSHMHTLDPRMRLHFNNVIDTMEVQELVNGVLMTRQKITNGSQLLAGSYTPTLYSVAQSPQTMRPQDILDSIALSRTLGDQGTIYMTHGTFATEHVKLSNRANANPAQYLSKTLGAYRQAMNDPSSDTDQQEAIYGRAADAVKDPMMGSNAFLTFLNANTSFSEGGSITYGELCQNDPTLDARVQVIARRGTMYQNQLNFAGSGDSEHWRGSNHETLTANTLAQMVPTLMMDLMLTGVRFMATNQTHNNEWMVQILGMESFLSGVDLTQFGESFKFRLVNEVLRYSTQGGMVDMRLDGSFDMIRDSHLQLSMGGGVPTSFTIPSFADAIYSPLLTNTQDHLNAMAHDIGEMGDMLSGRSGLLALSPYATYNQTPMVSQPPAAPSVAQPASSGEIILPQPSTYL